MTYPPASRPDTPTPPELTVLVAPDKFRGSLSAAQAADAMRAGVLAAAPNARIVSRPVADGGEGTLDALEIAGWWARPLQVRGPLGETAHTRYMTSPDKSIVALELADCCGRPQLPGGRLAPLSATTLGLGDALRHVLRDGARQIIVALGGSASTDGGAGMLVALGVRLLDAADRTVRPSPDALASVARVDLSGLEPALTGATVTFAVDVNSPLTGPLGAARLFGPQKGADPAELDVLEQAMNSWSCVLAPLAGGDVGSTPGAGAAGGVVAGALGGLANQARIEVASGAELLLREIGVPAEATRAHVTVVGEGMLDQQSLLGKAPVAAARLANAAGSRVLAVAGHVAISADELLEHGIRLAIALDEVAAPGEDTWTDAARLVNLATARGVSRLLPSVRTVR